MRARASVAAAAAAALWSMPAHAADCAALKGALPGSVKVVAATPITPDPSWGPRTDSFYKPLPVTVPLCRVEGTIEGNIGFELWLPMNGRWNGRLLGAGVGGDAGVFNYNDMSRRIGEGFATVTTDSGHKATFAHWMSDKKARVDYEHRAVHLTALAAKPNINLVMLGGELRRRNMAFYGGLTVEALDALHVDKLFLGVDGFDLERGITTHYEPEALLNRKMVEAARVVISITDSSKFGKVCLHRIIPVTALNMLITDTGAPEDIIQASHQLGFELLLA